MPPKKVVTTLNELINKQVYIQQHYKDTKEGPFLFLGVDQGFIKLSLEGESFWWSLRSIDAVREYVVKEENEST